MLAYCCICGSQLDYTSGLYCHRCERRNPEQHFYLQHAAWGGGPVGLLTAIFEQTASD